MSFAIIFAQSNIFLTSCENRIPNREDSHKCQFIFVFITVHTFSVNNFTTKTTAHDFLLHDTEEDKTNDDAGREKEHLESFVLPQADN